MKKREFNKTLKTLENPQTHLLDPVKCQALNNEIKWELVCFLVRARLPIVTDFLPIPLTKENDSWLSCCGDLYTTIANKVGFSLRHTCEHTIV